MTAMTTDAPVYLPIPRDGDPLSLVRFLTLIPEQTYWHFADMKLQPCLLFWCPLCDLAEDKHEAKVFARWEYEVSTEQGIRKVLAPSRLQREIEAAHTFWGHDLFLAHSFEMYRKGHGMNTSFHVRSRGFR